MVDSGIREVPAIHWDSPSSSDRVAPGGRICERARQALSGDTVAAGQLEGLEIPGGISMEARAAAMSSSIFLPDRIRRWRNRTESSERSNDLPRSATKSRKRGSKADMGTERLVSNLEQDTQSDSNGAMALAGSIDRMRSLLDDDNRFGCMPYLPNSIAGTDKDRHQRLEVVVRSMSRMVVIVLC